MSKKVLGINDLTEYSKVWHDFVLGNVELFTGHSELISLAFEAGYLAGKEAKRQAGEKK